MPFVYLLRCRDGSLYAGADCPRVRDLRVLATDMKVTPEPVDMTAAIPVPVPAPAPVAAPVVPSPPPTVDDPARRERALLLRAFESSPLSRANFCALKRIEPAALDALLATREIEDHDSHEDRRQRADECRDEHLFVRIRRLFRKL